MALQGFAARRIELTLTLEPDGFDSRGIDLPSPTRDVKTLLTLIRLDLERFLQDQFHLEHTTLQVDHAPAEYFQVERLVPNRERSAH